MNWNQDNISLTILSDFHYGQSTLISNCYLWGNFESDFLRITPSGYIHEYEIKTSRSDFSVDFKKFNYKGERKHDLIKNGESGLKTFSFVVPEGLVSACEVPDKLGLYFAMTNEKRNIPIIKEIKRPENLINPRKITDKKMASIWKKSHYRMQSLLMEKYREFAASIKECSSK